jgi:hypothetical protein
LFEKFEAEISINLVWFALSVIPNLVGSETEYIEGFIYPGALYNGTSSCTEFAPEIKLSPIVLLMLILPLFP